MLTFTTHRSAIISPISQRSRRAASLFAFFPIYKRLLDSVYADKSKCSAYMTLHEAGRSQSGSTRWDWAYLHPPRPLHPPHA